MMLAMRNNRCRIAAVALAIGAPFATGCMTAGTGVSPAFASLQGSPRTLAVAGFLAQNVAEGDAGVISDLLRAELVKTNTFIVVDKSNMDKILAEQAFASNSACANPECAVKVGKLLNVSHVVVGSVGKLLSDYFITARLVNVATGQVEKTTTRHAPTVAGLRFAIKAVAGEIAGAPSSPESGQVTATAASPAAAPPTDPGGKRLVLAVADLEPQGVAASTAAVVGDWLRGALARSRTYDVVERKQMQTVLAEAALQQTGCTSEDCAVRLGKALNAQRMIVGSVGKFEDDYVVNVRIVDVESSKVVGSDSASGKGTSGVELAVKEMAERLTQ